MMPNTGVNPLQEHGRDNNKLGEGGRECMHREDATKMWLMQLREEIEGHPYTYWSQPTCYEQAIVIYTNESHPLSLW